MSLLIPVSVVSGLGLFFGLGLSYASKVFEVKVDERIGQVKIGRAHVWTPVTRSSRMPSSA